MTVQYAWHYGYFANVYNKKWQYSTLGIMGIITTCACSKSEPGFPNDIYTGIFCVQWFEEWGRGSCSFCWNC